MVKFIDFPSQIVSCYVYKNCDIFLDFKMIFYLLSSASISV
jgi:hypothetical protein